MNRRARILVAALLLSGPQLLIAQGHEPTAPRSITLSEAVNLALTHNHVVHIDRFKVEEAQHAKEVAKSYYFPKLENQSSVLRLSELQHVAIPAGALGGGIPTSSILLGQGGLTIETSGTMLTQPLTSLLKEKQKNEIASADLNATRAGLRQTENAVALKIQQMYYAVLIAETHRSAIQAARNAADELHTENEQGEKYGSVLNQEVIESRAQTLQTEQELLSTELKISDLTMQLDDAMGLPLTTALALDPSLPQVKEMCPLEECLRVAELSHPEIQEAQQQMEKASAAVRLARRDYLPDSEIFARHSYQNGVPFLLHNFGTFGFALNYEIFDGGRRRAALSVREAELHRAQENLARVKDNIALGIRSAYNKRERTQRMVRVSEELVTLRKEAQRVVQQQSRQGAALPSQMELAQARALESEAALLQSQLAYIEAGNEMTVAIGETPQ
jgi:outer membrane protein TolC